jgi:hypothetical protein
VAVSAVTVIGAQRVPLARAADPFARMRLGHALLALGLVLATVVAAGGLTGGAYLVPVAVWSVGDVVLLGEPFAVVAGLAPEDERGRYLAAYGVSWGVAATLAPALAAGRVAAGGAPALWAACATGAGVLSLTQRAVGARVTRQ